MLHDGARLPFDLLLGNREDRSSSAAATAAAAAFVAAKLHRKENIAADARLARFLCAGAGWQLFQASIQFGHFRVYIRRATAATVAAVAAVAASAGGLGIVR